MVSCGFDGAALDPLGHMMLTAEFFGTVTKQLMAIADRICEGKLVVCHEGGYSPEMVPFCGVSVIETLAGLLPLSLYSI